MLPKNVSPYTYNQAIEDPELFVGRLDKVDDISQRIRGGESFAIIGGTRIGKTSLLLQVKRTLTADPESIVGRVVGPIFLSTHQFGRLTRTTIFATILSELRAYVDGAAGEKLAEFIQTVRGGGVDGDNAFDFFRSSLEELMTLDNRFQLFIMIDEVDELKRHEWSTVFFSNLRFLVSQSSIRERVNVMIAGTLSAKDLWDTAGSPFYNVVTVEELRVLSGEDLSGLIPAGFADGLPGEVETALIAEVGGHPYLMQFYLDGLHKLRGAGTTLDGESVQQIGQRFVRERRGDLKIWWNACNDDARLVLTEMASEGSVLTRIQAIRLCGDVDDAELALDQLLVNGLAEEIRINQFMAGSRLFLRWAAERIEMLAEGKNSSAMEPYTSSPVVPADQPDVERQVWDQIKQVELALRKVVWDMYLEHWQEDSFRIVAKALGPDVLRQLEKQQKRHCQRYPMTKTDTQQEPDILEFCYISQLEQLMTYSPAWLLFRPLFRDQREMRDLFAAIRQVRNDQAHFRTVPRRETERCLLACGDLLAILERNPMPRP